MPADVDYDELRFSVFTCRLPISLLIRHFRHYAITDDIIDILFSPHDAPLFAAAAAITPCRHDTLMPCRYDYYVIALFHMPPPLLLLRYACYVDAFVTRHMLHYATIRHTLLLPCFSLFRFSPLMPCRHCQLSPLLHDYAIDDAMPMMLAELAMPLAIDIDVTVSLDITILFSRSLLLRYRDVLSH